MSTAEIENRLIAVEQKLIKLAKKVNSTNSGEAQNINAWIDQIHGTFQNDATYRQGARLGRQWRKSAHVAISRKPKASPK